MTYKRFEDLPVWQKAVDLLLSVYEITDNAAFSRRSSLRNQLERAALSISNNIAEGFERGSTNELINFLYIARGSAGEVRSMLCVLEQITRNGHLRSQISDVKGVCENISRQLHGWLDKLQNSDVKGQRHLTDQVRIAEQAKRDRKELQEMLRRTLEGEDTGADI